jgi:hypothetical protein
LTVFNKVSHSEKKEERKMKTMQVEMKSGGFADLQILKEYVGPMHSGQQERSWDNVCFLVGVEHEGRMIKHWIPQMFICFDSGQFNQNADQFVKWSFAKTFHFLKLPVFLSGN